MLRKNNDRAWFDFVIQFVALLSWVPFWFRLPNNGAQLDYELVSGSLALPVWIALMASPLLMRGDYGLTCLSRVMMALPWLAYALLALAALDNLVFLQWLDHTVLPCAVAISVVFYAGTQRPAFGPIVFLVLLLAADFYIQGGGARAPASGIFDRVFPQYAPSVWGLSLLLAAVALASVGGAYWRHNRRIVRGLRLGTVPAYIVHTLRVWWPFPLIFLLFFLFFLGVRVHWLAPKFVDLINSENNALLTVSPEIDQPQ